jgi:hypothetical protein
MGKSGRTHGEENRYRILVINRGKETTKKI